MKLFLKIIISIFAVIGLLLGSIIALLFIPSFQQHLKKEAVVALSERLDTEVRIDSASLSVFSGSIALFGLDLKDRKGEPMLYADTLYGQVNIGELFDQHIDITDIKLEGTKANLYKERPDTAANYQFLIDTFKSDKKYKEENHKDKRKVSFDINNIEVTNTELSWQIKSDSKSRLKAVLESAKYHKGQISISSLDAEFEEKSVALGSIEFDIESKSGIVSKLSANDKGNSVSIGSVTCDSLKTVHIKDIRLTTDNGKPRKDYNKPQHGAFDAGHLDVYADIKLTALSIDKDSILVHIDKLCAEDKASGLIVDSMSALILTDTKTATISNLFIKDRNTTISIPKINVYGLKNEDKGGKGKSHFSFTTSTFYAKTQLCDIAKPFAPILSNFTTPLELTTWAEGTKDHIDFHKINVCTTDKRLKIIANGYIDSLMSKTGILVHFDVSKMSARNGVKDKILSHFPFKKSMTGVLKKIGDVGYIGSVDIPYMKQNFAGKLLTDAGYANLDIHLDNSTRYIQGHIITDSIHLGKIIENPNFGNLVLEASFKFDIAGRRSAKQLGRTVDALPAGWAKGVAREASYKKAKLRNTYFDINSNGKEASGDVRVAGALMDLSCKFRFSDTDFPKSLKVKPSLKFHKISEETKQRRAEKKAKKAEEKAKKKATD